MRLRFILILKKNNLMNLWLFLRCKRTFNVMVIYGAIFVVPYCQERCQHINESKDNLNSIVALLT